MKYIVSFFIAIILFFNIPFMILADEKDNNTSVSNVNLTVVIPSTNELLKEEIAKPTVLPKIPKLYPVNVYETHENDIRQIIKTYELSDTENPIDIPCEVFELDGWNYEISDIVKNENSSADVKEYSKTVSIDSNTKELNAIVKLLAPTIEYKSNDGYSGILTLDVNSIAVKTAGTKKNNFTISAVREYPNISNNDTSLIPKTITDNGKTATLSEIEWKNTTSSSIDYQELPSSYTAIVTYTSTGSKTVVTGYSVTAVYKGTISKMIQGKTIYTAIFNGTKIPATPVPIIDNLMESEITEDTTEELTEELTTNRKELNDFLITLILFIISSVAIVSGITFFIVIKKRKKEDITAIEKTAIKENEKKGEDII